MAARVVQAVLLAYQNDMRVVVAQTRLCLHQAPAMAVLVTTTSRCPIKVVAVMVVRVLSPIQAAVAVVTVTADQV
jgi:hypothetical protein